jgi:hypothetical protein
MDEAIEVPRRLLNLLPQVIIHIVIKDVCNQIQSILVMLNLGVQARQVEAVRQVFLIDLAEIFVAARS